MGVSTGSTTQAGGPTTQAGGPTTQAGGPTTEAGGEGFWRRNRIWFLVGVALLLALVLAAWTSAGDREFAGALDPQNPDPDGAQALAQVLGDEGVDVTVARSADELHDADADGQAIVLVTSAHQLAPSTVRRLVADTDGAELVLVEPPHHVLEELDDGVVVSATTDDVTGECAADRFGDRFEGLTLEVDTAVRYDTQRGCFPHGDGFVLAQGRGAAYLGAGQALSNDQVLRADNAAVALRLLGARDRLVWYVPTYDDARSDEAVSLWTFAPDWLAPSLWLGFLAAVGLVLWRGRRFGRLATEPLPVVVRAVETTRSRGRLYRRADDRAHAASALRTASRRRLADHLRLGRGADEAEVVEAVARRVERREQDVGALLSDHAPAPASDAALVQLAQELSRLDREVRRG